MDFNKVKRIMDSYENIEDFYAELVPKFKDYYHFLHNNLPALERGIMSQKEFVDNLVNINTNYYFGLVNIASTFPNEAYDSALKLIFSLKPLVRFLYPSNRIYSDMYDDREYLDKVLTTIIVDSSNLVDKLIKK